MKKIVFLLLLLSASVCYAGEKEITTKPVEINAWKQLGLDYCAASDNFKIGAILKVTNPENGKVVYCKVAEHDKATRGKKRAVNLSREKAAFIYDPDRPVVDVTIDEVS